MENTFLTIGDKTYTSADFKKGTAANEYKIYSDDVYATEFDKVFTCTISCNGVVGESASYSIKSYAYSKQDKTIRQASLPVALINTAFPLSTLQMQIRQAVSRVNSTKITGGKT